MQLPGSRKKESIDIVGKDSLFESSADVSLAAHTPSGGEAAGSAWTCNVGSFVSLAGGGFKGNGGADFATQEDATLTGDCYAKVVLKMSSAQYGGVALYDATTYGFSASLGGYVFIRYLNTWRLSKYHGNGGESLVQSTESPSFALDTAYTLRIERSVSGETATVKAFVDDTQILELTDDGSNGGDAWVGDCSGGLHGYLGSGNTYTNFESGTLTMPDTDIAASDQNFTYYGRWGNEGGERHTITNGSECEFAVSGAESIDLLFDVSTCVKYPAIAYWVDGVGPTRATIDATGLVTLAFPSAYAAVPYAVHRIRFTANIDSGYPTAHDNWADRRDALRFLGIRATGGELITIPICHNLVEFLGDSIVAGLRTLYTSTDGVAVAAPEVGWCTYAAELLGMRVILNGHGGQGITAPGTNGSPVANDAFGFVYDDKDWIPEIKPSVVVVYMGANDSSFSSGSYQEYLATIRAAYPDAVIFAVTPAGKSGLASAVSGAVAATGDARIVYLNYSSLSLAKVDDWHPSMGGCVTLGAKLATDVQSKMASLGAYSGIHWR